MFGKIMTKVMINSSWMILFLANLTLAQESGFHQYLNESHRTKKSYGQFVQKFMQEKESKVLASRRAPKALLLSAILPGMGQLYNKSYLKSAMFMAVETASWFVYFNKTSEGNRLDTKFKKFADAHWDANRYWAALANEFGCDINDQDCLKTVESENFSHHLPDVKNQTYYENIGKYNQFNIGWDDATQHRARDSQNREHYTFMRKDSNDAFELARTSATIVILNHIASALEAAFTAHKQDKRRGSSLNFVPRKYRNEIIPALALRVKW